MDQQFDPTPGLRLPQPSMNPGAAPSAPQPSVATPPPATPIEQGAANVVTQLPPQQLAHPAPAEAHAAAPLQSDQEYASTAVAPQKQLEQPLGDQAAVPAIAPSPEDKDDALDEPWIAKAKTTIEQYKADPYMQSRALSKLKAEYMQARHHKTLKVEE